MDVWTFVVEYGRGCTLVHQVRAPDLLSSVDAHNRSLPDEWRGAAFRRGAEHRDIDEPTRVDGTSNVWCITALDENEELVWGYIVKTSVA